MYLGVSSESYGALLDGGRLTLPEWFRLCAEELGLGAVELEDRHVGAPTPARLDEVRAAADRYRLEIVDIALMNNFGLASEAARRGEEARTVEWIGASRRLGSRFLRTFAGWPEGDRRTRWPAMLAVLASVCGAAERAGVRLVLENHNHGGFVQTAADTLAIFEAVRSPALGLLLDTGNYVDGPASIERTAHLARHVHAKCRRIDPDGRDALVDHAAVVATLRRVGYAGCLSVEYEGEEPAERAVPRAVGFLRELVGRA